MADVLEGKTAEMQAFWQHPRPEAMPGVLDTYIASEGAPYRDALMAVLAWLEPLGVVLDVGCHCGPVYARLRRDLHNVAYTGIDINGTVIAKARERFPGVNFIVANAREYLPLCPDRSQDVVISVAFLSCMDASAALEVLGQMARIAKRAVVIQEAMEPDGQAAVLANGTGFQEWRHDYPALFDGLGRVERQGDVWVLRPHGSGESFTSEPRADGSWTPPQPHPWPARMNPSPAFSDPPLRSSKIAIVGWAPTTRHLAPYDDLSFEIWAPGQVGYMLPRCDRIIEIHDNVTLEEESKDGPGHAASNVRDGARPADYLTRLRAERTRPVYLLKARKDIQNSLTFPINDIIQHFGARCEKLRQQPYITSTFGHAMALAILKLKGVADAEIHVYGVDLLSDEEYAHQRANAEFFGGYCLGAGIWLHIPMESAIFRSAGIYGYSNGEGAEAIARLLAHCMTRRGLLLKDLEQLRAVHSSAVNNLTRGEAQQRELDTLLVHLETVMRGGSIERPWEQAQ